MTIVYLILHQTLDIYDNLDRLVPASNPLKHEQIVQVVLFCSLFLFAGHYK